MRYVFDGSRQWNELSLCSKSSLSVKLTVFKAYRMFFYDIGLWRNFSRTMFNKLCTCYNKCIKVFSDTFERRHSVTATERIRTVKLHCALAAAQCIIIGPDCLFVGGWVCYYDNSNLRASILAKLGL